jgi:DNA-binding GntR family transcriptional regulator
LSAAGYPPSMTDLQFEARAASEWEAALLDLPPSAPVLIAREQTFSPQDQTVLLGDGVYRSDRRRFFARYVVSAADPADGRDVSRRLHPPRREPI